MKKHNTLRESEGSIMNDFLLNEMDYYVPDSSGEEDYLDDSMGNPLDYNTSDDEMGSPNFDDINSDYSDLDNYDPEEVTAFNGDDSDINYADELDGDDSFLYDMENDIDYMDDEEEEFYDNDLSSDVPFTDEDQGSF